VPVDWPGWSTDPGRFIGRPRPGTATRCDTTPPGSAGLCSGAMSILIRPSQLRIGEITSVRDGPQRARLHAERGPRSLSVMLAPGVISSACRAIDIPPAMPAATRAPPYRRQRVLRNGLSGQKGRPPSECGRPPPMSRTPSVALPRHVISVHVEVLTHVDEPCTIHSRNRDQCLKRKVQWLVKARHRTQ